jgi:cell division protein FtsN
LRMKAAMMPEVGGRWLVALVCLVAAGLLGADGSVLEKRGVWTVVHNKQRSSSLLAREDPDGKKLSVKDKIWKMGKDMCKDKPDNPLCKRFQKKEDEEKKAEEVAEPEQEEVIEPEHEEAIETTAKPLTTTTAATTTPLPTTTPKAAETTTKAAEKTKKATTTEAVTTTKVVPTTTAVPKIAEPTTTGESHDTHDRLGKHYHGDGKSVTKDWNDEYDGGGKQKDKKPVAKSSAASRCFFAAVATGVIAAVAQL